MLKSFKDPAALERSLNSDREYDGFDHIRSSMDTAYDTLSTLAKGVKQGANLYSDFTDASDAVNRATSKRQRSTSEPGLTVDRDGQAKVQKISQTTPVGHSSLVQPQSGIGASGTQVIGNSTAPPIQMKLGKQLMSNDSVANFLSLMSGSASVSMAFGGRLQSKQDGRVRTYQCFRHNLYGDGNLASGGPYPSSAKIMVPSGKLSVPLTGGTNITPVIAKSAIQDIADGSVYFSLYNKADLEDCSWNLNKFKLGPQDETSTTSQTVAGPSPKIQLLNDTNVLKIGDHRAYSRLRQNNTQPTIPPSSVGQGISCAPYTYDCVLKQGTVDYLFMNKGESPCEVEIVVYRIKKNGTQATPTKFSDLSIDSQLEAPITTGMMRKIYGAVGTDMPDENVGGKPIGSAYVSDPSRPFLPKNRFIVQSGTPYTEVNRVKLCMQSGQRRPFQLKLGGIQYDPMKRVSTKGTSSSADTATLIPMFDQDSYIVCIALNGIAMSRQLGGVTTTTATDIQLTSGPIVGDCYAPADLQWYSQYTEDVGAMSYKRSRTRNLFSFGSSPSFNDQLSAYNSAAATANLKITSTPVALLTQGQTVRVPQTPVQLRFGSGGVSGTEFATSTSNKTAATGGDTTTP